MIRQQKYYLRKMTEMCWNILLKKLIAETFMQVAGMRLDLCQYLGHKKSNRFYAAGIISSSTCCGVLYPSAPCILFRLYQDSIYSKIADLASLKS